MESIKDFLKTSLGRHVYSFFKTFIATFLAITFFADSQGQDVFTMLFIIEASKASTIVVARNIYKILTEK